MPDHLDTLLPAVESVDDLPDDALRPFVLQLTALLARAAVRMPAAPQNGSGAGPDRLLKLEEASAILGVKSDWLRRQRAMPFRVEISAGNVRYSAHGLQRYIRARVRK